MEIYTLNETLSYEVANRCKFLLKPKECYKNVALLAINKVIQSTLPDIKNLQVAYGAMSLELSNQVIYIKHCFYLYEGKVIDTCINFFNHLSSEYVVFVTLDFEDYLRKLIATDYHTLLDKDTMKQLYAQEMAFMQQGKILAG